MNDHKGNPQKLRAFSGIQPTGKLHIGNLIGAVSVWRELQDHYNSIYCVVDLHALTIPGNVQPNALRGKTREVAALLIAAGIDPQRSAIFVQSHVAPHAELTWLLNCITPVGWLERMTQYKTKSVLIESVGTGLLDYPVLQAADILLYDTDLVPVGEDQKQHIELTRDIAQRFNGLFEPVFAIPEPLIRESGARIMGLDEPTVKMSKSIGETKPGHSIGLLDPPELIRETIMGAVTDSGNETRFTQASPGIRNLLTIYETMSGCSCEEVAAHFEGKGYGFLKRELIDLVVATLEPVRHRYQELTSDPAYLEHVLERGADRAYSVASGTLTRAKRAVGLG